MINFKKHLPDIIIVSLSLLLCFVAFFNVIIPMDTFGWDESHHTLYGQLISSDIQNGDWDSFWYHTHRQTLWPFLQSWLLGVFFLFFEVSYVSARAMHLMIFFIVLTGTWFVGKALHRKKGLWIGGITWGLMVASKHSWEVGTEPMIEVLAVAITLFAFYSFFKLIITNKWIWLWPASILLALLMVTKYNFALPIYIAVLLWAFCELINLLRSPLPQPNIKKVKKARPITRFDQLKPFFLKYTLLASPSILMFVWWMFGPNSEGKWYMINFSKTAYVDKVDQVPGFFNNFLYYFNHLIFSYAWPPILGAVSIIGMAGILFLVKKKEPAAVILSLFVWVSMVIAIWVFMNKQPRYIYPVVPLIYLAAAYFWQTVWDITEKRLGLSKAKSISLVVMILIILLSLPQLGGMFNYFSGVSGKKAPGEKYADVLDYFGQIIPGNAPIACGNDCPRISPYTFSFHFRNRGVPIYNKFSLDQAKFQKGMYLVAFMQAPTPEKEQEDQWYKFIRSNSANLQHVDSKYFSKLNIKTEIYLIK